VVSRAFSALCVYSKFGHHPHSLGYLCAKFRFFRSLRSWASPCRKIAYSITHSPTQLIWCLGNRSACSSERIYIGHSCTLQGKVNDSFRLLDTKSHVKH